MVYVAGRQSHKLSNAQMIDHIVELVEQRAAESGAALFDRSNRDVLTVTGDDRLSWLDSLTSQSLARLAPGAPVRAMTT